MSLYSVWWTVVSTLARVVSGFSKVVMQDSGHSLGLFWALSLVAVIGPLYS